MIVIVFTIPSAEYRVDLELPTRYKIKVMAEIMPSPHDYGMNPQPTKDTLRSKGLRIYDHRDGDNGDDVTLYYPGFQRFIDQCNDTALDDTDSKVRDKMCDEMSKYFPNEKARQEKFIELMNEYGFVMESGGSSTKYDGYIDPCKCVILEVKKESGDSHAQAIAYYVRSLEDKPVDQCPAPAFLLELVGPHLFISGAVYGKYVFVDRLVDPVWLVPHQREDAMIRIARIFKALKAAVTDIREYYENVNPVDQPRFPIFQSFYKGNIQYKEAIKRHTFKGTLTYNGTSKPVFVTFAKQYSRETHEFMGFRGYAPQLIHYEERVRDTQYTAIVMEYIPDTMPLDEFLLSEVVEQYRISTCCIEALKVMHDNGFCQGKISSKSIFGKVQDGNVKILIVNYEWAGRQKDARYPLSADIPGVQPGEFITREHDEEQLDELLPYGLDRLFQ